MALRLPDLSPTAWNTLRNLFAQGFGLLLFAVQAPLLGPHAFGLITLVMIFVGFCEHVMEIATTEALLALREPDRQHYATMTTAGGAFAIVLGVTVALCADPIAVLFKEPELAPVLRWMALLPVLTAITTAPNAAARREMNFKPLAQRTILSIGISGIVGLTLTVLGYGVWALVWQAMLQRAINLILIWYFVPLPFELGYSRRHMAEMMPFTGPMLITQTMSWGAGQAPRFILGLYVGTTEVGLFSLASRLNEILLQLTISPRFQVARIEMRRYTDDQTGLADALARVLRDMAVLSFPMAIGAAAVMPVLFAVWLDARWAGGVVAAQLLMLMCLPYVTHYALSSALLGLHQQKPVAKTSTVQTASTVLAMAVAAPFGLVPAAAALAIQPVLTAVLPVHYLRRASGIGLATVLRAQAPLLAAAIGMGVVVSGVILLLRGHAHDAVVLAVATLSGVLSYAGLLQKLAPDAARPFLDKILRRLKRR